MQNLAATLLKGHQAGSPTDKIVAAPSDKKMGAPTDKVVGIPLQKAGAPAEKGVSPPEAACAQGDASSELAEGMQGVLHPSLHRGGASSIWESTAQTMADRVDAYRQRTFREYLDMLTVCDQYDMPVHEEQLERGMHDLFSMIFSMIFFIYLYGIVNRPSIL